jgi:hypothetical protein
MARTAFRIIESTGSDLVGADGRCTGPEVARVLSGHRHESAARRAMVRAERDSLGAPRAGRVYLQRRAMDGWETEVRGVWRPTSEPAEIGGDWAVTVPAAVIARAIYTAVDHREADTADECDTPAKLRAAARELLGLDLDSRPLREVHAVCRAYEALRQGGDCVAAEDPRARRAQPRACARVTQPSSPAATSPSNT